jgi:hypothetical protein
MGGVGNRRKERRKKNEERKKKGARRRVLKDKDLSAITSPPSDP